MIANPPYGIKSELLDQLPAPDQERPTGCRRYSVEVSRPSQEKGRVTISQATDGGKPEAPCVERLDIRLAIRYRTHGDADLAVLDNKQDQPNGNHSPR